VVGFKISILIGSRSQLLIKGKHFRHQNDVFGADRGQKIVYLSIFEENFGPMAWLRRI
jgi:hypothetical protein